MKNTKLEVCKKCWGTGRVHGGDENSTWSKTCEDCHGIGFVRVPKTNADRFRSMPIEEIADWLIQYRDDWGDYWAPNCEYYDTYEEAKEATIKWLQQPAEGE